MRMNRLIALGLSVVLSLSLAACGSGSKPLDVQIPDPFTEYQTLEAAEEDARFTLNLPQSIEGYSSPVYRLNKEAGLLEIIFENGDEEIRFRKAGGDGDISGNYNEYPQQETVDIDGAAVTMKGADGKVTVAVWSKDGYAYSIDCTTAIDKVTMADYVQVISMTEPAPIGGDPATWGPAEGDDPLAPPSPFLDCDSMEDAVKLAGFDMTLPKAPDAFQAWEGYMVQAFYGENGDDMLIRKAAGDGDISGDYNQYAQIETVDGVTLKGENNAFSLAIWEKDGYTYSICVGNALSQVDMLALAAEVQ